ncbi:MAG: hypothetical protein HY721_25840 [Planctomycetes bacterium]|nr:hypothetical protein [Planctomycetota bacterium]
MKERPIQGLSTVRLEAIVLGLVGVWLPPHPPASAQDAKGERRAAGEAAKRADAAPAPATVQVGLRKQLFVDDHVVAETRGVTRELGQVVKANDGKPVLVADKPWENADLFRFGTVIRDGDRFRMWYLMNDDLAGYAESQDGLHWTKPDLGEYEHHGSRHNNIADSRGLACFLDPHETEPAHKYKSAYGHPTKIMACLAHSPDGLHWTSYNGGEPVTGRAADTVNQLCWDEDARTYRLFTRTDFGRGLYAGTLDESRGTRDMINPDVKANPMAWRTVREWCFDREGRWEYKRRQVYSLNGWHYEGVRFGLLWCYEWAGQLGEGTYDLHKRHERDVMNFYIVTARGDEPWDLTWVYAEKPLVPRGPGGSFDKDWIQAAPNVITWQDKHWIYYCGSRERHDIYRLREGPALTRWQCAIGLATLRLDGFVCLQAKEAPGVVLTKPFRLEGDRLEVNADARDGRAIVEVLDGDGDPIEGFARSDAEPLHGMDGLRLRPRWSGKESLDTLVGRLVRLRFHLENAKLYAFQPVR